MINNLEEQKNNAVGGEISLICFLQCFFVLSIAE